MHTIKTKAINQHAHQNVMKKLLLSALIVAFAFASISPVAAKGAPDSFADLVEKLSPAVVNISTVQNIEVRRDSRRAPRIPEGMPFEEFWEQFRDRYEQEEEEPRQARSLGSGFIIDASGIVITNNHVIEDADEITVILRDGEEYDAELLGRDALSDLAVLKIEPEDGDGPFPFVAWGDDEASRVGDWVLAIGNPFGLSSTVTAGIISARSRPIGNGGDVEFIQTDASINRGNSGGPLFNMNGEVVGVNTAIFSPSGGNVGIGFSIPSNHAKNVVEQLRTGGKVSRGWLGVGIQALTEDIAETMGLDIDDGAIVTNVTEDSPASAGGLLVGDVIITWDGSKVEDSGSLSRLVKRTPIGKAVDVVIIREGKRMTLSVKTGTLPEELAAPAGTNPEEEEPRQERNERQLVQGMELAPLNDDFRQRYEVGDDVTGVGVLRVSRRSAAYRAGLRAGAVILRVDQQPVDDPVQVADIIDAALDEGKERILILVNVRGNSVHIPLRIRSGE